MPRSIIIYAEKECAYCKNLFKYDVDHKNRKYCNYKCAKDARKSKILLICIECNRPFERWSYNKDAKYCSYTCKHNSMKSDILSCKCVNCGNVFLRKEHLINTSGNIFCTKKCAHIYNSGSNHYEWKDNLHDKNIKTALKQWAIYIKKRDNYACQECGDTNKDILQSHHIVSRRDNADLIFDYENGITLCLWCHHKKHLNDFNAARLIMLKIQKYTYKKLTLCRSKVWLSKKLVMQAKDSVEKLIVKNGQL